MKRILLLQCLSSVVLIALAVWVGLGLLTNARLSQQSKVGPLDEASRNPVLANHAEWNQFYDAVSVGRPDPTTPGHMSVDPVPGPSIAPASTTTSPVVSHPASSERAVKTDAPSAPVAALPDRPHEKGANAPSRTEQSWNQELRETAPSVAATESAPPEVANPIATPPVSALDANADKPAQQMTPPAAIPLPRAKVTAPAPPVRSAARVKQAAPEADREPERSRPSTPSRARVALPRQRNATQSEAPQWSGTQWVEPQHFGPPQPQSGALSYAPSPYNAQPPASRNTARTFLTARAPPTAQQQARARQYRSPQPFNAASDDPRQFAPQQVAPRQPAQSSNNPYGWR